MTFNAPPGLTLNKIYFPYVVMQDRIGIFVLAGRSRIYCDTQIDAVATAMHLHLGFS
jgi:hypothetical protein